MNERESSGGIKVELENGDCRHGNVDDREIDSSRCGCRCANNENG